MYGESCDRVLLAGDFNAEEGEICLNDFLYQNNLKNIVKESTCFKNPQAPTCIDLFLTNFANSFQHTRVMFTGLLDFHKMTLTVLKSTFTKSKPRKFFYRCYKSYNRDVFKQELKKALSEVSDYDTFETIYLNLLNKHAPPKVKTVRDNQAPYMTKALRKAIMRRSLLKTKLYKNFTTEDTKKYKKQKNYCSRLYKKERKKIYEKLDINHINDNKLFWKTVKPFLTGGGRVLSPWNTAPEVPIWLGGTHPEFDEVPMGTNSVIFQKTEIKVHKH